MNRPQSWPLLADVHTIAFDFDGVFTNNKVFVDQNGVESVRCDRGDGLGIDLLRAARDRGDLKAEIFILSKEPNPVVLARARKLKLDCRHGVADKKQHLEQYFADQRPGDEAPFSGLVYLGNDLNDLSVMQVAGFSVAPTDAHPLIRRIATVTLEQPGGEGFVRAFVEHLLDFEHLSVEDINERIHHR